uniref:Uncharacterized protein n=1 Tax=Rhizophora mucronata TaxID=61149 RepID=A0A2P2NXE6_RHIMU
MHPCNLVNHYAILTRPEKVTHGGKLIKSPLFT